MSNDSVEEHEICSISKWSIKHDMIIRRKSDGLLFQACYKNRYEKDNKSVEE
jgi:hypothetical protein